jgi:uncharacterized protein YceK
MIGLVLFLCAAGGCGTVSNVTGHEPWLIGLPPERPITPFGGVDNDVRWMSRGIQPDRCEPGPIVAGAVDMPLSFVGDVLTLPWTTYQWLIAYRPRAAAGDSP